MEEDKEQETQVEIQDPHDWPTREEDAEWEPVFLPWTKHTDWTTLEFEELCERLNLMIPGQKPDEIPEWVNEEIDKRESLSVDE